MNKDEKSLLYEPEKKVNKCINKKVKSENLQKYDKEKKKIYLQKLKFIDPRYLPKSLYIKEQNTQTNNT